MPMRMMHVRHMRMLVTQAHMAMPMGVGLGGQHLRTVLMLMMRVMNMAVPVFKGRMFMLVFMYLGEMKPDTHGHQYPSRDELRRDRFMQDDHGNDCAQKGSRRKVRARARRAEMTKRKHEKRDANAVAEKADETRDDERRKARHRSPAPEAEQKIGRARNQAFQLDDLQGIGKRNFAGEVVVEAPCHASSSNGDRPEHSRKRWLA